MKIMSKFYAFGLTILFAFLIGCAAYFISTPTKDMKNVNGVEIEFPIKLDNSFEITNATLNEDETTVIIKNMNTNEIYESTLLSEELEDLVCNQKIYSADNVTNVYDCSTETNTIKSMIIEIGKQSVELINEGY